MKFWILVMAAVALLVWSLVRERFEATPSIKAPPYKADDKRRIFDMVHQRSPTPPYGVLGYQDILMDKAKQQLPSETNQDKLKEAAGGIVTPVIEAFFNGVFKPATTPITKAQVDAFVDARASDIPMIEKDILTTYFVGQSGVGTSGQGGADSYAAALAKLGQNAGYLITSKPGEAPPASSTTASGGNPPPACPVGLIRREEDGKCINASQTKPPTCPANYTLTPANRCKRTGGTELTDPTCPAGYTYNAAAGVCDTTPVDPTCPSTHTFRNGACEPKERPAPATTTGGSSTSTYGPTTGGPANRIRQVFGPQFAGSAGDLSDGATAGDSSQTNVYPELLGGMIDSSSRIPGAGITAPSKNYTMTKDGTLPPKNTMGSDEMSRYFPFSRSPGDMDVIPDPYRVAQTFSASSYSSKTEPTPFLTDFSAFQK